MKKHHIEEEPDDGISRSQSFSDRWPLDMELREKGFQIHDRPEKGPVVWERLHKTYTQEEALRLARGA